MALDALLYGHFVHVVPNLEDLKPHVAKTQQGKSGKARAVHTHDATMMAPYWLSSLSEQCMHS